MMKHGDLIGIYADRLLEKIAQKAIKGSRSYGFEYEFLSANPLTLDHMDKLYRFLPECGFVNSGSDFRASNGMYIDFEPGGQIEYHSPPLFADEENQFFHILETIETTNLEIFRNLGIQYLGTGYISGRGDAPLCLTAKRYQNLHARMPKCGTRGREMMKGTASIHLHVVIRSLSEIPLLFSTLCEMAGSEAFQMQPDRRDIWDNTDPCRCGLPFKNIKASDDPKQVIGELVRIGLKADDISENIPFEKLPDITFDGFMYHMTTLFTDVRLNIKGPTIELRTLDSMPPSAFGPKWREFISLLEGVLPVSVGENE